MRRYFLRISPKTFVIWRASSASQLLSIHLRIARSPLSGFFDHFFTGEGRVFGFLIYKFPVV